MPTLLMIAEAAQKTVMRTGHPAADHALDVMGSSEAGQDTYAIATFVLKIVDWILGFFGLEHNPTAVTWIYAAVVFGLSILVGWVAQLIILGIVEQITKRWSLAMYPYLKGVKFFHKLCSMIPAIVFLIFIQFTLVATKAPVAKLLTNITLIYVIYVTAVTLSSLVLAIWRNIDERKNKRRLPLSGLVQLIRGIIWIIAAIVAVAILVDKSPGSLLAGLGAFAAVLMLIFKDSILGLVAGVQLSEDDSLHVGDWIKVNGTDANGTVTEVNLISVKVLNWDKTTTMLPPYSLVSGSFTNYRSMQQSNTRRILRTYYIDADSILPATDEMIAAVRKLPFMEKWIAGKLAQKAAGKVCDANNPEGLADGSIETNLGMFRAYMKMWLDANVHIDKESVCFVSTLQQTSNGIPFQIWAFTSTSAWLEYEAIQDAVFEHVAVMLAQFSLYCFEAPSGRDTVIDGYLSPGKPLDKVFGIPEPFFKPGEDPAAEVSKQPGK